MMNRSTISRCLLVLVMMTSLSGCESIQKAIFKYFMEPSPPDTPEGVEVIRDVGFTETPDGVLKLDIYRPIERGEKPLPVVVYLFGGGWEMGNKNQVGLMGIEHFATAGYAVISIDYRVSSTAIFPAQIYDSKAVIRWISLFANEYQLDPRRIGVIGPSAGGHLAALLGTSGGVAVLEGTLPPQATDADSSRVQAVVDFFGPTDMLQASSQQGAGGIDWDGDDSPASKLFGGPLQQRRALAALANPITYISSDDPPFLIIHGDEDFIVPLQQSQLLLDALQAAGVESELVIVEGGSHGFGGDFYSDKLVKLALAFFDRHIKPQ
jgi:acetyl esterase/lipase